MTDPEVARFLQDNPAFFQQYPDLFTGLLLPDPHQGKAVSLVERQALLLRERVHDLELRLAELLRIGRDNDLLARRLVDWTRALLAAPDRERMAAVASESLRQTFGVPLAETRLWGADPRPGDAAAAAWAATLAVPACGTQLDLRVLDGLPEPWSNARSVALIPLRAAEGTAPFGLLILGSSDPARFDATLGTALLARIGELASAALAPAGGARPGPAQ